MTALDELNGFNLSDASVLLWTFKGPRGPATVDPSYTGRWVETEDDVDEILKATVENERSRIEEVLDYSLLAQNNESSALLIASIETHAGLIIDQAHADVISKKVSQVKDIRNSNFYVIKLVHGESVIWAVKKAVPGWKTKGAFKLHSVIFSDDRLGIDDRPHFDLAKNIDFFIVGDDILCLHKSQFESILRYKRAHKEDFEELLNDEDFASLFVDLAPLQAHVGENKIQLRRASAIRQKGHYRDAQFMERLQNHQSNFGLSIQFDGNGKIVATPETVPQIITALLDHRLVSGFSENVYDVQSTMAIEL